MQNLYNHFGYVFPTTLLVYGDRITSIWYDAGQVSSHLGTQWHSLTLSDLELTIGTKKHGECWEWQGRPVARTCFTTNPVSKPTVLSPRPPILIVFYNSPLFDPHSFFSKSP
jgi:hypothetical protein